MNKIVKIVVTITLIVMFQIACGHNNQGISSFNSVQTGSGVQYPVKAEVNKPSNGAEYGHDGGATRMWDVMMNPFYPDVAHVPFYEKFAVWRYNDKTLPNFIYKYKVNDDPWIDISKQVNAQDYGKYYEFSIKYTKPGVYNYIFQLFEPDGIPTLMKDETWFVYALDPDPTKLWDVKTSQSLYYEKVPFSAKFLVKRYNDINLHNFIYKYKVNEGSWVDISELVNDMNYGDYYELDLNYKIAGEYNYIFQLFNPDETPTSMKSDTFRIVAINRW